MKLLLVGNDGVELKVGEFLPSSFLTRAKASSLSWAASRGRAIRNNKRPLSQVADRKFLSSFAEVHKRKPANIGPIVRSRLPTDMNSPGEKNENDH
jgi:hypothetical protein